MPGGGQPDPRHIAASTRRRGLGRRAPGAAPGRVRGHPRARQRHGHGRPRSWRGFSSRSSPPSPRAKARAWAWPRCSASSARTTARSGPRANRAAARPSTSSCRASAETAPPQPDAARRAALRRPLGAARRGRAGHPRAHARDPGIAGHGGACGRRRQAGPEARRRKSKHLDLLFCDVVLPGLSGIEVADRVRKLHPESGGDLHLRPRREDYLKRAGLELPKVHFVEKPSSRTAIDGKDRAKCWADRSLRQQTVANAGARRRIMRTSALHESPSRVHMPSTRTMNARFVHVDAATWRCPRRKAAKRPGSFSRSMGRARQAMARLEGAQRQLGAVLQNQAQRPAAASSPGPALRAPSRSG